MPTFFFCVKIWILSSFLIKSLQIFNVLSVDALSDIINSKSVKDCAKIDSIDFLINNSPLYTGIPIVNFGFKVSKNQQISNDLIFYTF